VFFFFFLSANIFEFIKFFSENDHYSGGLRMCVPDEGSANSRIF